MIPSTAFSFDESSAWDPKVIREQLCIPEDQLNILSNLPGWFKVPDRVNTYRLSKDTSTQQSESSQSNFSTTAQNSQKDLLVTTQNSQKDSPVSSQNFQKDSPVSSQNFQKDLLITTAQNSQKDPAVSIQNCEKDSPVSTQNCEKDLPLTIQICQKDKPVTTQNCEKDSTVTVQICQKGSPVATYNYQKDSPVITQTCQKDLTNDFDLLDKHLQLCESALKAVKVRISQKRFVKSVSLCEIDKIGENLPNCGFLKRTLSLPILYQSFDNPSVKLCQNSDCETVSPEKSMFHEVLERERFIILDQKDTSKSSNLSKANLEVMEVITQLPEKIVKDLTNQVVDTMTKVSVALTTESFDNLGIQPTGVENGIAPVNNGDSIVCENEHKDKPALESHANKLDSCVKEIIPTGVNQTIVIEQDKINFISAKSVDLNSTPVLITELQNPVPNEQSSKAEKLISINDNLQDAKIEPKEQKVPYQENDNEANKPATENKCVQGKRKSEFKIKSSKKHKSARDVKPGNGEINEARNIRKAGEICFADDDIITMINVLKHYL